MRALAVHEHDEREGYGPDRYTQYNNVTLSEIYNLTPLGTSCIFIDYKLYKDEGYTPSKPEQQVPY